MPRRTVERAIARARKMARPKVTETVPTSWATEDFVLSRLKRTYENAQLGAEAYQRRGGSPEMLATLARLRDNARAALTQYLNTEKRKP